MKVYLLFILTVSMISAQSILGYESHSAQKVKTSVLSPTGENLLKNSSFESGFSPWQLWFNEFGSAENCTLVESGAAHGQRYVQVESRQKAMTLLTSKAVKYTPGAIYTLSALVKGTPGKRLVLEFYGIKDINRWFPVERVQKVVDLTEEWQRVSVSGQLPPTELNRCFVGFRPEDDDACAFAVDAVKLSLGEPTKEFCDTDQPHFSFVFGENPHSLLNIKGGVYTLGEKVSLEGSVYQPHGSPKLTMTCELLDINGEMVYSQQKKIKRSSQKTVNFNWTFSGQPLGWYRVILRLKNPKGQVLEEQISSFVRVEKRDRGEAEDSPFGMCVLGNPDVEMERAVAMGVKHVRMHDCGFFWGNIFPKLEGDPIWRADSIVNRMSEVGLTPFPYIGQGVKPIDRRSEHNRYSVGDLNGYEKFFTTLTKHYQQNIPAYEVENEPYFRMSAKEYFPMLKAAYQGAKKGNPNSQIIGVSGDPRTHHGFISQLLKMGSSEWMDAMSIHAYVNPEAPEWRFANALKGIREEFNAAGGVDKEIWLTETGYKGSERHEIPQRKPATRQEFISLKQYASYIVRTHILTLGNGINRLYWFSMGTPGPYVYPWSMNEPDSFYSPKPAVAAYAAMTRQLANLKFMDSPVNGSGSYAYRFSGEGRNLTVVWSVDDAEGFLPVKAHSAQVYDIFGNPVHVKRIGKNIFVPLSEMPHYITSAKPIDPQQIISIHSPTDWDVSKPSLPLSISFSNPFPSSVSGRWEWDLPEGWMASPVKLSISAGQTEVRNVEIHLSSKQKKKHLKQMISGRWILDQHPPASASVLLEYVLKPTALDHDIWFEAEEPDHSNFAIHPEPLSAAFGGAMVKLETTSLPIDTNGFSLGYDLMVEEPAEYEIYVASLPAGQSWSSPIDWKIGDMNDQRVFTKMKGLNSYSPNPIRANLKYHFFKLGDVKLAAGKHTLELSIAEKRKMDTKYVIQLDAICLRKKK